MPLNAGQLNTRITLQRRTADRDAAGGAVITYPAYAVVWGHMRPLTGREVLSADQEVAAEQGEVTIRYRADVDPTDRLSIDGRLWAVSYVGVIGDKEGLRLIVKRPEDLES